MKRKTLECDALAGLSVRCVDGTVVLFIKEGEDPNAAMAAARPRPGPPPRSAAAAVPARRR